jgi:hypothetical protein
MLSYICEFINDCNVFFFLVFFERNYAVVAAIGFGEFLMHFLKESDSGY